MSEARQVKVDNWGIYFLQKLKHFFNRTDYCDLTLQFQDNAQLKVHRLVLSACTEYFELLERTCEMYEDCLVMPDDLQADVVVPIINFMYTGQLEFKLDLLEKLYQTSLILNMAVLTKLLDAHRPQQKQLPAKPAFSSANTYYGKRYSKVSKTIPAVSNSSNKRPYSNAFENVETAIETHKPKKTNTDMFSKAECILKNGKSPIFQFPIFSEKNNHFAKDPRPTRYELPEELDEENLFDNSFTSISYTSKPLMIHPEMTKQYGPKRINLFDEGTSSSRFMRGTDNDVVECRKISSNEGIFRDSVGDSMQEENTFQPSLNIKEDIKDTSQLFDQILDSNTSKITIETKNNMQAQNIDHAKIISEVLKKYPHLVKSNKNIKLKILNTVKTTKKAQASNSSNEEKVKPKSDTPDFTYESDVINSKEAARLIALGAENISGPWICLICGTPGKALHFTSYFNFRKHLVEIHNEKPVPTICEYCGVKSGKRNYLVHHKLSKHGIPAPPAYNFPKCNHCNYVALNEALLAKHKSTHDKNMKLNLATNQFSSVSKNVNYSGSPITKNLQCIYCLRIFLRERNLYAHLKSNHKEAAKNDCLVDDSEEEQEEEKFANCKLSNDNSNLIKVEVPVTFDNSYEDINDQYQIEQKPDGSIYVRTKKPRVMLPSSRNKILNLGFPNQNVSSVMHPQKTESDPLQNAIKKRNEILQNAFITQTRHLSTEESVIIDNNEYILQGNHLIPKKEKLSGEYNIASHASNDTEAQLMQQMPTTSVDYRNMHSFTPECTTMVKKSTHINQPLQIVVSNEEEYKALMNANQSVIYDEGETNKELSELGGPDNSSLETGTIDLDSTQSNDMMIIPNFPINMPASVAADNSNIVVVYSHPVEDQNKQYSLITTQGLEGEFVQSSTIITQNYETVTTCTPMTTTHTTIESSWQNNDSSDINKLTINPSTELQTMTLGDSITITPLENVSNDNLNELPDVQLTTVEPVTIQIAQTEIGKNTFDQTNIINTISQQSDSVSVCQQNTMITIADSTVLNNMQQLPQIHHRSSTNNNQNTSISSFDQTTSVNTLEGPITSTAADEIASISREEILQQNVTDASSTELVAVNIMETSVTCDSIIEDTNSQMNNDLNLSDKNVELHEMTCPINAVEEDVSDKLEETPQDPHIAETTAIANDSNAIENPIDNHKQCLIDQDSNIVTLPKIVKEQIENLTSEWSEEEGEITPEEQSKISNINLDTRNDKITDPAEMEETIENIQKEVEKKVSDSIEAEQENNSVPLQTDSLISNTQTKDNENTTIETQENISSLLNDWDDNDSQEDNISAVSENGKDIQTSISVTQTENVTVNNSADEKLETNKIDNIKNLVSDWDEEEEDENKN